MKYCYLVLFILIFSEVIQAQNDISLIERKKELLQNQYYILGEQVPIRKVVKLMRPYEPAYKLIRSSRRLNFLAATTAGIGLSVIAAQLINLEDDNGFNFLAGGFGVGLFLGAVGISIKADRNADKAIELYNRRKLSYKSNYNGHIGIVLNARGIGIQWVF